MEYKNETLETLLTLLVLYKSSHISHIFPVTDCFYFLIKIIFDQNVETTYSHDSWKKPFNYFNY